MNRTGLPLTFLRMTARNLYRRPMRTALAALGVAIGVVAIVSFSTLVRGLWDAVDATIHLNDAELMVFQADVAADLLSVLDEEETRAKLTAIPEVREAIATLWHILPVAGRPFYLILGLRLEDMPSLRDDLIRGRCPQADDELVLGSIACGALEKDLDDVLHVRDKPYRVVGVFRTDAVFLNGAVIMSLPRLQHLAAREGRVSLFQVHLQRGVQPAAVAEKIEREHPDLVAVGDASEYHKVDQGLEIAREMVWAVSFLAIVIGSIIIANTMWMTVLQRTREIGVLRAVGWPRRRIMGMIVLEAAGVGLLACPLGWLLGAGLAELTTVLPVSEQFMEPVFSATPFLLALGVAVVLSVLGALLPAWRAGRISPAEALRYE